MGIETPNKRISIVVPALNEETVVFEVLTDIHTTVAEHFQEFELIAVNDGSTDRTGAEMDRFAALYPFVRIVHNDENQGLGAAYKREINEAKYEYYMLLCGDGGLPASSLPSIFAQIGKADIVAPYMTNLKQIKTATRYLTSRIYTNLLNLTFGNDIKYYNGLAVHRTDLLRKLDIHSTGFAFQGEVLTKLLRSGCSYLQVGVLGAENTNKSSALKMRNLANVARTLFKLIFDVIRFDSTGVRQPQAARDDASAVKG